MMIDRQSVPDIQLNEYTKHGGVNREFITLVRGDNTNYDRRIMDKPTGAVNTSMRVRLPVGAIRSSAGCCIQPWLGGRNTNYGKCAIPWTSLYLGR